MSYMQATQVNRYTKVSGISDGL